MMLLPIVSWNETNMSFSFLFLVPKLQRFCCTLYYMFQSGFVCLFSGFISGKRELLPYITLDKLLRYNVAVRTAMIIQSFSLGETHKSYQEWDECLPKSNCKVMHFILFISTYGANQRISSRKINPDKTNVYLIKMGALVLLQKQIY